MRRSTSRGEMARETLAAEASSVPTEATPVAIPWRASVTTMVSLDCSLGRRKPARSGARMPSYHIITWGGRGVWRWPSTHRKRGAQNQLRCRKGCSPGCMPRMRPMRARCWDRRPNVWVQWLLVPSLKPDIATIWPGTTISRSDTPLTRAEEDVVKFGAGCGQPYHLSDMFMHDK